MLSTNRFNARFVIGLQGFRGPPTPMWYRLPCRRSRVRVPSAACRKAPEMRVGERGSGSPRPRGVVDNAFGGWQAGQAARTSRGRSEEHPVRSLVGRGRRVGGRAVLTTWVVADRDRQSRLGADAQAFNTRADNHFVMGPNVHLSHNKSFDLHEGNKVCPTPTRTPTTSYQSQTKSFCYEARGLIGTGTARHGVQLQVRNLHPGLERMR